MAYLLGGLKLRLMDVFNTLPRIFQVVIKNSQVSKMKIKKKKNTHTQIESDLVVFAYC